MFFKKNRVLATFWKFWFVKDFMNFKAKLPKWNVKIFSRNFAGVIFSPKSRTGEFCVGIWKSQGQKKYPSMHGMHMTFKSAAVMCLCEKVTQWLLWYFFCLVSVNIICMIIYSLSIKIYHTDWIDKFFVCTVYISICFVREVI